MRDIGKIIYVNDLIELSRTIAEIIVQEGQKAINQSGRFMLALSGGLTPQPVYRLLTTTKYINHLDWSKVYIFFTDERCVPPDHSDSNFYLVKHLLLDHVRVRYVYRMHGECDNLLEEANRYEKILRESFEIAGSKIPRFDLMLLGLGEDGHTASLFPGFDIINEKKKLIVTLSTGHMNRISLSLPVIDNAKMRVFGIIGNIKKEIITNIQSGEDNDYQVSNINYSSGKTVWVIEN